MHPDDLSYLRFTGPQQRDKALHSLLGILEGFAIDGSMSAEEIRELRGWADDHRVLDKNRSFREVLEAIDRSTNDGAVSAEEIEDLRWVCVNASTESAYFEPVTREIQHLHGMLHGVLADRKVSLEELDGLSTWIDAHDYLRSNYPFDEIESVITSVIKDRKVEDAEHGLLLSFFEQFANRSTTAKIREIRQGELLAPINLGGVCALCPEIEWSGREFCFTGFSKRGPRSVFANTVREKGGTFADNVTQRLNYLVVGNEGNPCWAFSCYGRKVESAVQLRRAGHPVLIVHENDFWDSA